MLLTCAQHVGASDERTSINSRHLRSLMLSAAELEAVIRNDEVVGSIPTSSTIFSITCGHPVLSFCPKVVQNILVSDGRRHTYNTPTRKLEFASRTQQPRRRPLPLERTKQPERATSRKGA